MKKETFQDLRHAYQLRFEPENYLRVAISFWTWIFLISTITILISVAFGAWQFVAPPNQVTVENTAKGISGFNREQLKKIVDAFEKRQTTFETMMSGQ